MASKNHNQKTLVGGIQFDSCKEARRYQELLWMQRAGLIRTIEVQPRYALTVNGHKHKGDFRSEEGAKDQPTWISWSIQLAPPPITP